MFSPAKINLFLKVLSKRPDGYHELETVFLPLPGLADEQTISQAPPEQQTSTIKVTGDYPVPADASNLCLKAVQAFNQATGTQAVVNINLNKKIPVAAGLGGGSSDAATTLLILNRLYRTRLDAFQLRAIARTLGADVPFFIKPEVALATGIGDILTPIPLKTALTVLLVTPCFPLPVAWAYQHRVLPETPQPELKQLQLAMLGPNLQELADACRNDLEHAILQKFPILTLMRDKLLQLGALCAHVSGSGPSLFALVKPTDAQKLKQDFAQHFPGFPKPSIHSVTGD